MYVGHKNTNLHNVPPTLCKFMSGHIFDIYFHLPPQRAVPCHGEEPHAAAARRRCCLCRTLPLPAAATSLAVAAATAARRTPPPPPRTPSPTTTVRPPLLRHHHGRRRSWPLLPPLGCPCPFQSTAHFDRVMGEATAGKIEQGGDENTTINHGDRRYDDGDRRHDDGDGRHDNRRHDDGKPNPRNRRVRVT